MDNKKEIQPVLSSPTEIEALIEKELKNNNSLLIQSNPGMARNFLIKSSADKSGLKLVEFTIENANGTLIENELITSILDGKNGNVILLSIVHDSDISDFVTVAKSRNIPLIISLSNNIGDEPVFKTSISSNPESIKEILDEISLEKKKEDVLTRMKGLQHTNYVTDLTINTKLK